jgi:hypothetical protein
MAKIRPQAAIQAGKREPQATQNNCHPERSAGHGLLSDAPVTTGAQARDPLAIRTARATWALCAEGIGRAAAEKDLERSRPAPCPLRSRIARARMACPWRSLRTLARKMQIPLDPL